MRPSARRPARALLFAVIVTASTLVGASYVALAVVGRQADAASDPRARVSPRSQTVIFQDVTRDSAYAHVAIASTSRPDARKITPLVCERVHHARGHGLCLLPVQGLFGQKFTAKVFGSDFRVRHELRLPGIISRARVSPDGRFGATMGFVAGHSYTEAGGFSTQTTLIDMRSGKAVADLEDFKVLRSGRDSAPPDRNFWGVTFKRDSNRFYATMETAGQTYLVEGDIRQRLLRALRENVECPSLSPDQTRIAYKKRDDTRDTWSLAVLDLRTMEDTVLPGTRAIDDQPEWLDDEHVLYGRAAQVWSVPVDGSGVPRRFLSHALSPAVQRPR